MNARHVVKFFLNLLSIHLELGLALLIALNPRSQPHLYYGNPNYVAAVIYVTVELINLIEHPLVVLLCHPHVFLDHLYFFFEGFDLNVIYFIFKFAFFVLLKLDHLILSHLALDFINHLHVEFTLQVFFTEHGNDVLVVILLETMICRNLEM